MKDVKHTPGPWRIGKDTAGRVTVFAGEIPIAYPNHNYYGETLDNDDLLTAAPELLEACEAVLRINNLWMPGPVATEHEAAEARALHDMQRKLVAAVTNATRSSAHFAPRIGQQVDKPDNT